MLHTDDSRETSLVRAFIIGATVVTLPGLRRQRLLAALTQEELAQRAGVRRGTIVRLEQGRECQPPTARKIADALGVLPQALIEPDHESR